MTWIRQHASLAVEAVFGALLLALGKLLAGQSLLTVAALGALLVAANALLLVRLTGMEKLRDRGRTWYVAGIVFGGALAFLGAALATRADYWLALVVFGTLLNMEFANLATAASASPAAFPCEEEGWKAARPPRSAGAEAD